LELNDNRLAVVLHNLALVRDQKPGHEAIKALLFIPGGAMRGAAINAGQVAALIEQHFGAVFQNVVGISSGAAVGAYFMTGNLVQVERGCKLVYERIPSYVHPKFTHFGRVFDTPEIETELKGGPYAPNIQSILESPTGFYVGVMVRRSGEFVLLNAHNKAIHAKIRASMTIPWISRGKVVIGGTQYVDGGFYPFPLEDMVGMFEPTDILILSNKTVAQLAESDAMGKFGKLYAKRYPRKVQLEMQSSRDEIFRLSKWEKRGVNIGVLLPPDTGINGLSTDSNMLKDAITAAGIDAKRTIADLLS
jgi:predicted acylesterase/phospholipase RssA